MIFGSKNKEGNRAVNLSYVDGLDCFGKGLAVELSLNDSIQSLTIKSRISKKQPIINLKYDEIIATSVVSEEEIIEKNKNAVGRAIVGGVLLGPLGAIVGGMSGIGEKKDSSTHYYMVINYKSKDDETKVLSFEIVGASLHWSSFMTEFRTKFKKQDIEKEIYL